MWVADEFVQVRSTKKHAEMMADHERMKLILNNNLESALALGAGRPVDHAADQVARPSSARRRSRLSAGHRTRES